MNVPNQRKQIALFFDQKRSVTPLEEVTDPIVALVEALGVRGLERQHDARESNRAALDRKVFVGGAVTGPVKEAGATFARNSGNTLVYVSDTTGALQKRSHVRYIAH